ncbi:MAG: porin family protein [Holosporaceae bacterium]|jgi:hypothetical protein|nr:porin family protein [Holosporaceae bacterium]
MKKLALTMVFMIEPLLCVSGSPTFDGIYTGIGVGYNSLENTITRVNGSNVSNASQKFSRPFLSIFFGSGKTSNTFPIYWGGEISISISKADKKEVNLNNEKYIIGDSGLSSAFHFRLAYNSLVAPSLLLFLKFGISYNKATSEYNSASLNCSKLGPTFGGGIEQKYGNISYRLDAHITMDREKKNDMRSLKRGVNWGVQLSASYYTNF